jgi:hypothetical protein
MTESYLGGLQLPLGSDLFTLQMEALRASEKLQYVFTVWRRNRKKEDQLINNRHENLKT